MRDGVRIREVGRIEFDVEFAVESSEGEFRLATPNGVPSLFRLLRLNPRPSRTTVLIEAGGWGGGGAGGRKRLV